VTTNVRLILATVFLVFATQTIVSVLVPLAASQIGLGTSVIGLLVALPLAVGIVTDIPLAKASDVFGRRPALIAGSVIGGLGAIALMTGSGVLSLVVGSLLFGLSFSSTIGPALAFVTEAATPTNHARIQGFNGAIQGLSALVGATAAGAVTANWGVRVAFLSTAALMVGVIVLAWPVWERPKVRPSIALGDTTRTLFRSYVRVVHLLRQEPAMLMAGAGAALYGFQFLIVGNAFVPVFLVRSEGFSSADAGLLLGLRSLVATGLSLTFGLVVARLGMVRLIVLTNALGIVGIGLVPVLSGSLLIVGAFLLQGVGIAFSAATVNLLITSATTESERALGFSAAILPAKVTGVILPIVLGLSALVGGYGALFLVAEVMGALMVATIVVLARHAVSVESPS
jgi:MFS family permease